MPKYTIELRHAIERGYRIFDFPYDFYNEEKRCEFEKNFIRHFYFREIGQDSIERFVHHLNDKMQTVFPYYNELFKAAEIEYSILNNYNMTEKTTISRENEGRSAGISSTVGKVHDEQTTSTMDMHETETSSTNDGEIKKTGTVQDNTNTNGTETEALDETATQTESTGNTLSKKFLDTPVNVVSLNDNITHLTNIGLDEGSENKNLDSDKNSDIQRTKSTTDIKLTTYDTTDGAISVASGTEKSETNGESIFTGNQQTQADANSREYMAGTMKEEMIHTRIGNIGIDTDSDMINKHIRLQKILRQIEKMFFDECEDLFMLVW